MQKNKSIRIFVLEDNEFYRQLLKYNLTMVPDYEVRDFSCGKELLNAMHEKPDIITLDYSLPDFNGDQLLKKIKEEFPEIPVIIISEQGDITTAIDLMRKGAYDYITKDENTRDHLLHIIGKICNNIALRNEVDQLKDELGRKYEIGNSIYGNSPALLNVFSMIEKSAGSNITVTITGETGTGKELVAKSIHYLSARKSKPFINLNIATVPEEMLESELFGHEKGSFDGARAARIGKLEEASGGTIFLDEITELNPSMQAKLLRVLQERELSRIGSGKIIRLDARFIISSRLDLFEEVRKGKFREDLYYRLIGMPIYLPALRERGNDILIIAKHVLSNFCQENKLEKLGFSPEAQDKLLKYYYPGNVRELKAIVELSAILSNGVHIEADDVRLEATRSLETLTFEESTLEQYNMRIIRHFLEKNNYNVVETAKKLDVGKSTIYRYLKENKIRIPEKEQI